MATKEKFGKMLNEKPVAKKVLKETRPKDLEELREIAKKKTVRK